MRLKIDILQSCARKSPRRRRLTQLILLSDLDLMISRQATRNEALKSSKRRTSFTGAVLTISVLFLAERGPSLQLVLSFTNPFQLNFTSFGIPGFTMHTTK